jgi:hypothetical protein
MVPDGTKQAPTSILVRQCATEELVGEVPPQEGGLHKALGPRGPPQLCCQRHNDHAHTDAVHVAEEEGEGGGEDDAEEGGAVLGGVGCRCQGSTTDEAAEAGSNGGGGVEGMYVVDGFG